MPQLIIDVPDELAGRMAAAVRAIYPTVVAEAYPDGGETEGQAMRAVVAWWSANLLADYEVERVRVARTQAVLDAQADLERSVAYARGEAWRLVREAMARQTAGDGDGSAEQPPA